MDCSIGNVNFHLLRVNFHFLEIDNLQICDNF